MLNTMTRLMGAVAAAAFATAALAEPVTIRVQSVIPATADEVTMLEDFAKDVAALTADDPVTIEVLPAGAVQSDVGETFVYVVEGSGEESVAARQDVEVLAEVDNRVAVNGLGEGVRVIRPVPNGVREGTQLVVSDGP